MKQIVKRVLWAVGIAPVVLYALFYIGVRWGYTPLPKPPLGVRLEPLAPPLARDDLKPDNAAFYYMKAADLLSGYKQSDESRKQMEALLANDTSGDTKDIKQTIADCREALDLVRQGSRLEFCQMPLWDDSMNSLSLTISLRRLARLLVADGKLAEQTGAFDRARDNYLVTVKFGAGCSKGGSLMASLLGYAITDLGAQAVRAWALTGTTSPKALQDTIKELSRASSKPDPYAETLRYELPLGKRLTESAFRGTVPPITGSLVSKRVMCGYFDAVYGDCIQDAERPYWQSERQQIENNWRIEGENTWLSFFNRPIPRMLLSLIVPSLEKSRAHAVRAELNLEASTVVCALRAYTLTTGHAPEQLADLMPEFLPSIPIDPFDGKPLRYRREGTDWVLWSVGSDMKDNNAQWHEFKYKTTADHRPGGDMYFKSTEPQDDLAFYLANPKTKH